MKTKTKLKTILSLFVLIPALSFSQVKLPKLVSDGMVLQRDANVKIWGWASAGEKVTIQFMGSTYNAVADKDGNWETMLPKMKAGGPYEMQIDATNSITINNILIGDVWVCSGQSNMQLSLRGLTSIYPNEIATSENPNIRQFMVVPGFKLGSTETDYRFGKWQSADPKSVINFTAAGYFFAKYLFEIYKVPIGLINASVGGSSAEAWISQESIKEFPKYFEDVVRYNTPGYMERINKQDNERVKTWNDLVKENDLGHKNGQHWSDPGVNTADWDTMHVPGYWADTKAGNINGMVWFRRQFNIPANMTKQDAQLKLGRIVDADSAFINGKFVGSVGSQYAQRNYKIKDDVLKEGTNTIVIKVTNYIRHGGFVPEKPYEIIAGSDTINLSGEWKFRVGAIAEPLEDRLFTGKIPTGLYNSMIAPMVNYSIKGVIWYQGESNTSRAFEHFDLFKLLIKDWRTQWKQGNFPFLYVQLPNFVEVNVETTKYDWAYFRESQLKALSIPNTGMAVTVDIGEWNDIHPVDKKDVGYRLALVAQKVAYGDSKVVYSGPLYKSMEINGNQATLSFTNTGSGLIAKNSDELNCFEICGIDNNFVSAKAKIVNNKVVVWSEKVSKPVAVRYAWANNPVNPNLYNKEGLPASPFRTSDLY